MAEHTNFCLDNPASAATNHLFCQHHPQHRQNNCETNAQYSEAGPSVEQEKRCTGRQAQPALATIGYYLLSVLSLFTYPKAKQDQTQYSEASPNYNPVQNRTTDTAPYTSSSSDPAATSSSNPAAPTPSETCTCSDSATDLSSLTVSDAIPEPEAAITTAPSQFCTSSDPVSSSSDPLTLIHSDSDSCSSYDSDTSSYYDSESEHENCKLNYSEAGLFTKIGQYLDAMLTGGARLVKEGMLTTLRVLFFPFLLYVMLTGWMLSPWSTDQSTPWRAQLRVIRQMSVVGRFTVAIADMVTLYATLTTSMTTTIATTIYWIVRVLAWWISMPLVIAGARFRMISPDPTINDHFVIRHYKHLGLLDENGRLTQAIIPITMPIFLGAAPSRPLTQTCIRMGAFNTAGHPWTPEGSLVYLIVDSGSSRHVLSSTMLFTSSQPCNITVTGISKHQESATSQGVWGGYLMADSGAAMPFSSYGVHMPTSPVSLLSVGQMSNACNSIIHDGQVDTGHHCVEARLSDGTSTFILFYWCPDTMLWWMVAWRNPVGIGVHNSSLYLGGEMGSNIAVDATTRPAPNTQQQPSN